MSGASATSSSYCQNGPDTRACWGEYDINTNYYDTVPNTGVTREFWLELVNTTASPDGYEMGVLTVNGTIPGPTLVVDWGDEVIVHVTNKLENNGSTIHWHGLRQYYNNQNDGVPSVVQCPSAPNTTYTYKWRAEAYGTTWYHSHFAVQAWDGVFGAIIINGPATANYDTDLGTIFLNDWSHQSMTSLYYGVAELTGPPTLDTGLINGTMVSDQGGAYFETKFEAGKVHRLRLISAAVDTTFKFSVDEHNMTVIANDLVPVVPYSTETLSLTNGQRYDVIIDATQSTGDFWMRSIPQAACSENANTDNILGIVRYDSSSTSNPNSTAWGFTDECVDPNGSLEPWVEVSVGDYDVYEDLTIALAFVADKKAKVKRQGPAGFGAAGTFIRWEINEVHMVAEWDDPSLLKVYENNTSNFTSSENVYELPDADEWVYVYIHTQMAVEHPIHLHGKLLLPRRWFS